MTVKDCRLLEIPSFSDPRGNLSFVEGNGHIPFDIARVYYIWDIPDKAVRGAHGHRELRQFVIAVSGSFDVILNDGLETRTVRLERPDQGLYICPMIWRDVTHFSDGAVCLSLASLPYDEADYFRVYEEFLAEAGGSAP
jgi:hypothetical protein